MKMASTYNPYSDIQKVYNAKVAWNNATTDAERKRQQNIANSARKNLEAYGYSDVANQISASGADATAARKIMESYAPTAPASTNLSNTELITKNNNEVRNKINDAWGTVQSDKDKYYSEYDKVSDYVNKDVTNTDEYKSAFKNIMPEYNLKAMQGRDNAVASGGASNGGNIDSYAAANALRQQAALTAKGQAALTAKGQALAHQIGLETYNARVGNARNILSDLGVYQKDSWNAMGGFIDQQQKEGQRLFENEETAKNNEAARLSEQASVTGYVPNEWTIKNDDIYNIFLNEDGTFKKEQEGVDIQALINQAKANGDTETAKKLAVVRTRKIFSNYGDFGKYANVGDISSMSPQKTETADQFDKQNETALKTLGAETDLAKYEIDANKTINAVKNATDVEVAKIKNTTPTLTASQAATAIKNGEVSQAVIDAYNYYYGTKYTVANPPKIGDDGSLGLGDDSGDGGTNDTPTESKDIFTQWENNGVSFNTVSVGAFDETKAESVDVDKHGKKAINDAISAVANGKIGVNGIVSNYDLANYLITHSDANDTNKNQLTKVFAYFGLDKNMLEQVEDSGFWFWQWGQGTNYKK